mgnify:CR=1 FL=1
MAHGGGGEDGDPNRWLVSYADFITLLMVLFVVLYSMGQTDVKKYKQLAESMRAAFSVGGPSRVVDSSINQGGGTGNQGESNPIIVPGIPKRPPDTQQVAGNLTQMLTASGLGNQVSVHTNIEGGLISLGEKLLFKPGTVELMETAYPVLDSLAKMLVNRDEKIRIVGHTDNSPIVDKKYASNVELSVARAVVVSNYLQKGGIKPERISISGMGEYEPVFKNDTSEHRAMNNRVEIIVLYRLKTDVMDINTKPSPLSSSTP